MKLLSENAKTIYRYIDIKCAKSSDFVNKGDLFNAGYYYGLLELIRNKIDSDYKHKYILELEKEYLYETLISSMVSVLRLVEDKSEVMSYAK